MSDTTDNHTTTVYLSLGSNIEPRLERLNDCARKLARIDGCTIEACSSVYESAAVDMPPETAPFLNQVVRMRTTLPPSTLLQKTEALERQLGRDCKGQMQSRTIDIDILLYGDRTISAESLTVPHPRMGERAFVLVPLLELDKTLKNPNTGLPYCRLCDATMSDKVALFSARQAEAAV